MTETRETAEPTAYEVEVGLLEAAIDNVRVMTNQGTIPDARCQVLATLAVARAVMLVAERLCEIHQLKYELKS